MSEPAIHGIWVARLQQAMACHSMGRLPIGDFQYGGTTFAHKRMRVMVAMLLQFLTLQRSQIQGSSYWHNSLFSEDAVAQAVPLPNLIIKVH
jgi:hypothetical protein